MGTRPDPALLTAMAETMTNRGPDAQGVWHDAEAGLAFRRLAIIDLDERSNQPMHLGELHLVFNGEIYNYRELRQELREQGHAFRTEGDGEVLLHAWAEWGDAALDRLNGMYAFAIWDARASTLTLASDRFGEKPLYYVELPGNGLAFASEIKALLRHADVDARPDETALALYLGRGAMPDIGRSFFAGVRRLPGSHVLRWHDGRSSLKRYWSPRAVSVPHDYDDAVAALRELLVDSIRLRLRSDVPVGTSLSGGVDSSAVVALSAHIAGDHTRHAFTASFPDYERDEWSYAAEVATAAGVEDHHRVTPTADEALRDLDRLVLDHEEPVASLSMYAQWRVNAAARDAGVVVLLDGQGGDELFAGYAISHGYALRSIPRSAALRQVVRDRSLLTPVAGSLAIDAMPRRLLRLYRRRTVSAYVSPQAAAATAGRERPAARFEATRSPLARELFAQAFDRPLPELLRYADRSSMAHSREVRLPFLDPRVAEFAFSLPASSLYMDGISKRIARDAVRGVVPSSVLDRRDKVAFEPPQARWLNSPEFRARIADVLLDAGAARRGLYNTSAIEADLARGRWRDHGAVWRALNAELWQRTMVESI